MNPSPIPDMTALEDETAHEPMDAGTKFLIISLVAIVSWLPLLSALLWWLDR